MVSSATAIKGATAKDHGSGTNIPIMFSKISKRKVWRKYIPSVATPIRQSLCILEKHIEHEIAVGSDDLDIKLHISKFLFL